MYDLDPDARKVIDVAKGLEGLRRQDGIHAAAVVITDEPLTTYLPIQRKPEPGGDPEDAPIVTQYEMHGVEDLGLLKMDFLGLRNLDVITDTVELIRRSKGEVVDIDAIPLDDEATVAMLCRGESIGVFQLEGGPMRALMRSLAPERFEDVAALVALYRPGPMAANMHNDYADRKNGRKPIVCLHPELEELLADTYGLMIYQESIMRVAEHFAGYTLEEADNLRKACGKKIRPLIAAERVKFVDGCAAKGFGRDLGSALFDIIEPFADYAFARSHAFGYGLVAYQTAWLKANHPVEYLAALLTSVKDDQDKAGRYLNECRARRIPVLVPDVNLSRSDFSVTYDDDGRGSITFGLSAVRNVGEGLVAQILETREAGGPFVDFEDFCDRVPPAVLNKRAIESLVKAGAFDCLGHERRGLLAVFEAIVDRALARRRREAEGQFDLFSGGPDEGGRRAEARVDVPDLAFDKKERLAYEKEMLGLYVSDHPLMGVEHLLRRRADATIAELRDTGAGSAPGGAGEVRTVGGVVTSLSRRYTKKGELMGSFVLEDLDAAIEVMVFPKAMAEHGHRLVEDAVVCVKGRLDTRDDLPKVVCMEVLTVELDAEAPPLRVSVPTALDDRKVADLKRLLGDHPGPSPVLLQVGSQVVRLPPVFNVDTGNGLAGELRVLLGAGSVRLG
jgi:DNA polymerase III subunit alpha